MQQPDSSAVEALLDFFRWLALQIGIDQAIGIALVLLLVASVWRVYTDRRSDRQRIEELVERNRTIQVLERELTYYKARELARSSGLSFEEARKLLIDTTEPQVLYLRSRSRPAPGR